MLKESIDSHKFLELEGAGDCVEDEVHAEDSGFTNGVPWRGTEPVQDPLDGS